MVFVATPTNTKIGNTCRWKPHPSIMYIRTYTCTHNPQKINHECQKTAKPRNFSPSKITRYTVSIWIMNVGCRMICFMFDTSPVTYHTLQLFFRPRYKIYNPQKIKKNNILSIGKGALMRSAGWRASGAGANSRLAVSTVMLKEIWETPVSNCFIAVTVSSSLKKLWGS